MARFLPSRAEWRTLFDTLSKKEKFLFIFFFLVTWTLGTLILVTIDRTYSTPLPASGGSLTEGIVGIPRFINPLLAISDADRDMTQLVFAGLTKFDGSGGLAPDLAERYEVSPDGLTYTFFLRDNLFFHDGHKLTTDDVAFTIHLAQNPVIHSNKLAYWEGVSVDVINEKEIRFYLKRPFAPFLESTTIGILPKHLWNKITPEEFSLTALNIRPVGSGPFQIENSLQNKTGGITGYTLSRFARYQPSPAYLSSLTVQFYPSEVDLQNALQSGEISSAGIETRTLPFVPSKNKVERIHLPRTFALFFNSSEFTPFQESALREALARATDREKIIRDALGGSGTKTSLPIPPGSPNYTEDLEDTRFDIEEAKSILTKAKIIDSDNDGVREFKKNKETTPLQFKIATLSDSPELVKTAQILKETWGELGISVDVDALERGDLEKMINSRNYQCLLFGQLLGLDPDPYGFWHSSQRKPPAGLNITGYTNTKVDKLLDQARSIIDPGERSSLYRQFQQELMRDRPAIFLYSQLYLYTLPAGMKGVSLEKMPSPHNRFSQITKWYLVTKNVWNIFVKK